MRTKEAIARADAYRPNAIEEETKAAWLYEFDVKLARETERPIPEKVWPADRELLIPAEDMYVFYLASRIDIHDEEMERYANDMTLYTQAYNEEMSWWIRNNKPTGPQRLKVM